MRTRRRAGLVAALALLLPLALAPAAHAAPPPHDDLASPTPITSIPFTDDVDTSEATRPEDEPSCWGGSSVVWYELQLDDEEYLSLSTEGSDHAVAMSLWVETEWGLENIGCSGDGEGGTTFPVFLGAGTFLVGVEALDAEGGQLTFSISRAPAAQDISLGPVLVSVDRAGRATISTSIGCAAPGGVWVSGSLSQKFAGRGLLVGTGDTYVSCTPPSVPVTFGVSADNGTFGGGRAQLTLNAYGCDAWERCDDASLSGRIGLSRNR
ncbi:hypothetical protein [Cellulomonas endophytica]|uniref:hypothetical protein n=1 Tax=Cellulomonas endophytica TaxID=2494735 RepID=UPI001011DBB7|nr:hypothetical protein [Cellulomonas endophytica]